ncbi:MAG: hypothetical protein ACTSO9_06640 [Candidatus Helarchaeota archaeon]
MTKTEFFNYFNGKDSGYAIKIRELEKFRSPKKLNEIFPGYMPPQSFCYVDEQKPLRDFML